MTDEELKELLDKVQNEEDVSNEVLESALLAFMEDRGLIDEGSEYRKAYKKFFNKVRLSESQYNHARDRLEKIVKAADIVREALVRLDEDLENISS